MIAFLLDVRSCDGVILVNRNCRLVKKNLATRLFTSDKAGGICFCPCSFVCLSVCEQDYSKKTCMYLDVACRQMSGHGQTD